MWDCRVFKPFGLCCVRIGCIWASHSYLWLHCSMFLAFVYNGILFYLLWFLELTSFDLSEGNYLINYLATRGPELQPFVTGSLIQLFCRVTKFGWFDDDRFRDVVKESMNFLSQVIGPFICVTIHAFGKQPLESYSLHCFHHFFLWMYEVQQTLKKNHMYDYYVQFDFEMMFLC